MIGVAVNLNGAIVMVAYGKADMARYYVREAIRMDAAIVGKPLFWKALLLVLLPNFIGRRAMEKRMKFRSVDADLARSVERSLRDLKFGEDGE